MCEACGGQKYELVLLADDDGARLLRLPCAACGGPESDPGLQGLVTDDQGKDGA